MAVTEVDNLFADLGEPKDKYGLTNTDYVTASKYCNDMFSKEETLEKAWIMYTHRERYYWGPLGRTGLNTPIWVGKQDIRGKTLVLGYEQAIGESIMFSSMLPDLLKLGCKVIVEVDKRLVELLGRSFPEVTFVPWDYPWDKRMFSGDFYTLLGSIGYVLRKTKASFEGSKGFLVAKPLKLPSNLPKVGLSWFSPMPYAKQYKSVPYEALKSLTDRHNKELFCVNLQYGVVPNTNIYSAKGIDLVKDIDGVCSLIDDCDVVVTISNTVAHLAGGLGKKVYLLLQKGPARLWYWNWGWYKGVEVIEKSEFSTWEEEIERISGKIIK